MSRFSALKDPDSTVDYQIDWSQWLGGSDTILTSTWQVPTGLTYESDSRTTTTTTVWVSGGTVGAVYPLTCRVTTAQGRITDRTIHVRMIAR